MVDQQDPEWKDPSEKQIMDAHAATLAYALCIIHNMSEDQIQRTISVVAKKVHTQFSEDELWGVRHLGDAIVKLVREDPRTDKALILEKEYSLWLEKAFLTSGLGYPADDPSVGGGGFEPSGLS